MAKLFTLSLLLIIIFFSGCARLDWLDEQAGKLFYSTSSPSFLNVEEKKEQEEPGEINPGNLSKDIKQNIDEWLENEGLNRYGDPEGTYYTGGTPLFNESTGVAIERYQYILGRVPGILEKIK
ncbi:hypothetical protein KAJ89_03590 [Candidatus Parcubacteria bacterium]|nr:hypothetical protein [Candidatus Parcubacteria bacterium]